MKLNFEERFWKKVKKGKPEECWEWMAGRFVDGNGNFWDGKKNEYANRYSWYLHYGDIPKGLLALHRCDNPPCVNPNHLFLGTHKDNIADCIKKGRKVILRGEDHGMSKLTKEKVLEIRRLLGEGKLQKTLAQIFDVTPTTIHEVGRRKTWKHL